ncbi:MAG: hypothetical protein KDD62_07435 [Bdellovibrionales bacterium]|nr:hypothetical protein [Bdellovibrionales bacterium]
MFSLWSTQRVDTILNNAVHLKLLSSEDLSIISERSDRLARAKELEPAVEQGLKGLRETLETYVRHGYFYQTDVNRCRNDAKALSDLLECGRISWSLSYPEGLVP